jgi:hypothetical protein
MDIGVYFDVTNQMNYLFPKVERKRLKADDITPNLISPKKERR